MFSPVRGLRWNKGNSITQPFFCSWVGSVATVIPGMMSKTEVLDNLAILKTEIPPDFWEELKAEGLLRADTRT